jgi:SOS-response transcriptional repressor LexA
MRPRIFDGDLVTIAPCTSESVEKGDVVLVRIRGNWLLHLVTAAEKGRIQISNNHGHVNGWAGRGSVLGKVRTIDRS